MDYLRVGHHSLPQQGTGVSVFLLDQPAPAAYALCGSSPATRELHTLELDATVSQIDALVFAGGSAFGLGAADGVMQWLQEKERGVQTLHTTVPIVPAACIYDLGEKSVAAPSAAHAYEACNNATSNNLTSGRIGAGTGATVGKLISNAAHMPGGFGCAEIKLANGLCVQAYAVVNCVGDVFEHEKIIAGARTKNAFADCTQFLLQGHDETQLIALNTTLVAVFTNAAFTKIELKRIAKVALTGMARAISPVFTRYDGDAIFCVSLGDKVASETTVAVMAAEAVRQAIVAAVK